jgi:hypothetical protein
MARRGAVMTEAIVHHYCRDEILRRVANPFGFQSRSDGDGWHSSGITTRVLGALKRGRHSRATSADDQARALEGAVFGPSVEGFIARERTRSHEFGGRSVFGWEPPNSGIKTA